MNGARRDNARVLALQFLVAGGSVAAWELASYRRWIDPFFFSRPSEFLARCWQWLTDPSGSVLGGRPLYEHVAVTLEEMIGAFVLGVGFGIAAGFALGRSVFWARVLHPFIQVLNALPRLVLAPIFVLILGIDESSKVALGFSLVFFIVFFNAYQGVREVDRNLVRNALMLGASPRQLARHVLLPSALTWILSSLHTSVGFALVGAVVGEYLAAAKGLGWVISQAQGNFDAAGVYAGMTVLAVIVLLVEAAVTWIERRLVHWKPAAAGDALTV